MPRSVAFVCFEGFELLDVFGPAELFGRLGDEFAVTMVAMAEGPVASAQGPRVLAGTWADDAPLDVLVVPGGIGTRALIDDGGFLEWLAGLAARSAIVASVCTGSGLLAAAGLLEGKRATSNKRAFAWPVSIGGGTTWVPEARWVVDGTTWTSSGVAAGMDMALALIAELCGADVAERDAFEVEYEWHRDPGWDPFARAHGLVD